MDPKACLLAAESAICDNEHDEAREHLENYADWRTNGGFEPTDIIPQRIADKTPRKGDEFHAMMGVLFGLTFYPYAQ
jgi:hypothetical protein